MIRSIKTFFDFMTYITASLLGFVLAFVLAVQFLPLAVSETKEGFSITKILNSGQKMVKDLVNKTDVPPVAEEPSPIQPPVAEPNPTQLPVAEEPNFAQPPVAEPNPTQLPVAEPNPTQLPVAEEPNPALPSKATAQPPQTAPDLALPTGEIPAAAESETPPSIEEGSGDSVSVGASPESKKTEADVVPELELNQGSAVSQTLAEIHSYMAPYIYDSSNRLDPFNDPTINAVTSPTGGSSPIIDIRTPPEEHSLEEIQLKGIIWDTKNPKALFKLPFNDSYYTLSRGSRIGKNGIIFEIREDEVVILENLTQEQQFTDEESSVQSIKILKLDRLNL